jgi:hypothetical protein
MSKNQKLQAWISMVVALLSGSRAPAAENIHDIAIRSLKGIEALQVRVEDPGEVLKSEGLDASALKVEAELRLRKAGVSVSNSSKVDEDQPLLRLKALAERNEKCSGVRVSYFLYLYQVVRLERDRSNRVIATTWGWSKSEMLEVALLRGRVRERVSESVDAFLNDFLTANPVRR